MGSSGLEPPTSSLSGTRSNQLSYEPYSTRAPGAMRRVPRPISYRSLRHEAARTVGAEKPSEALHSADKKTTGTAGGKRRQKRRRSAVTPMRPPQCQASIRARSATLNRRTPYRQSDRAIHLQPSNVSPFPAMSTTISVEFSYQTDARKVPLFHDLHSSRAAAHDKSHARLRPSPLRGLATAADSL